MAMLATCGFLAACDSGGINISPVTNDNRTDSSVNNSNNTSAAQETNPCASYVNSGGQTIVGDFDGINCEYSPAFADAGNNIMTDITIPALDDGGVHVFRGSLFIGEAHSNNGELQAAGIVEGGDGPVLTIEAGAVLAFPDNTKFVIINRGSQIFAVGTADQPIVFTGEKDAVEGAAEPEEVQIWGGMVINGFGVSNKCEYTGVRGESDFSLVGECNIAAEGAEGLDESYYGGSHD
ncbi:MAG: serine/threonine protein kinase, partial [Proteobacteria bacterium]|nr:serine/threonine protein kinase [Pseudomonadota bacterium]